VKCYYHLEKDAVAICKSCNRALCHDCAVDVHPGTACKNRCESDVQSVNTLFEKDKTSYQKVGKTFRGNAIALLSAGLLFTPVGLLGFFNSENSGMLIFALMGFIFLFWSFSAYRSAKRFEEITDDAENGAETS